MDYERSKDQAYCDDSELYTEQNHEESTISESGSSDSYSACDHRPSLADEFGLIELFAGDRAHDLIYRHCKSGLGDGFQLLSILRNEFRSFGSRAKLKTFQIFTEAVAKKHNGGYGGGQNGGARVKYGWCAVGREEVKSILEYGFSHQKNDGSYGRGLYLSPDNTPLECLKESEEDDGIRFLLLSRVLLGKSEIVPQGSTRSYPSSPEFDSGLDDLASPKKYIVWSTHMNTHVLPEFLVCIKTPPNLNQNQSFGGTPKRLKSPWMAFSVLIKALSKFLPPSQISIISKHYKDQQNRKISRHELIQRIRMITGDKLLVHIIKALGHKLQ